jgi:hypothetical protein
MSDSQRTVYLGYGEPAALALLQKLAVDPKIVVGDQLATVDYQHHTISFNTFVYEADGRKALCRCGCAVEVHPKLARATHQLPTTDVGWLLDALPSKFPAHPMYVMGGRVQGADTQRLIGNQQ